MGKEEILELLDELMARVEGPAAQVFDLAVRSVLTSAIIFVAVSGFAMVNAAWFVPYAAHKAKTNDEWYGGMFTALGVGFVATIVLLINIHALLNVHYNALRELVPGL